MNEFREQTKRLLWSLWSEMGVPGGGRVHRQIVLDPEPLIAFTPHLARQDNRLMGLAFDWCAHHAGKISKSRLAGLSKLLSDPVRQRLAGFNGALASQGVHWRPQGERLDLTLDRDKIALPLERPPLLIFRIRAFAGVSARADVLVRLLFCAQGGADVSSLTPPGTSRRNVERVLAEFRQAGLVLVHGSPRRSRFRLSEPASFAKMTNAEDLIFWDWHRALTVLDLLHGLIQPESTSPRLRRIHAVSTRKKIAEQTASQEWEQPPRLEGREDAFEALLEWGTAFARSLANGEIDTTKK